jgi:hypothetical protein
MIVAFSVQEFKACSCALTCCIALHQQACSCFACCRAMQAKAAGVKARVCMFSVLCVY